MSQPSIASLLNRIATLEQENQGLKAQIARLQPSYVGTQEHKHLLTATAQVANLLLWAQDYMTILPEVVRLLGEATKSARCCLTQDVTHPELGVPAVRVLLEFCQGGVPTSIDCTPGLETALPWESLAQFRENNLKGVASHYLIDELQEPARSLLSRQGLTSLLVVPILVQGKSWGQIGFDNCGEPRLFDETEIAILKIAADSLAAAIDRRRTQQALLKAEQERVAQLARANTTLKKTLDALATEPDLDRSLGHVLQVITEQLNSPSAALWLSKPDGETFSLHLVYLNGSVVPVIPENTDRLSRQWIRDRDLSRDLSLKAHIRDRTPIIYDLQHHPEVTPSQRQFMEHLGVKLLLGVPLLLGTEIVGSFTVRFTERREFSADELELVQALAHQATLAIQLMHLADEAKQAALLEERNRMAGEIHDTLAQAFTGISIQVGMAQKLVTTSPNDTQQILDRVLTLAQTGLAEARRSVWAIHPTADEYADLAHNMQACIHHLTDSLPMQVEIEMNGTPYLVPAIVGQNLLRIAQEAINNTIDHAQATQLRVRLTFEPTAIALSIQDNGRGFEPQSENGGFGLMGMSDRASRLNGHFTLCSQPGHGTEIRVKVPIK